MLCIVFPIVVFLVRVLAVNGIGATGVTIVILVVLVVLVAAWASFPNRVGTFRRALASTGRPILPLVSCHEGVRNV